MTRSPAVTRREAKAGQIAARARAPAGAGGARAGRGRGGAGAPAAAVAEWPDGKELEEGVFIRGAISASQVNGLARSKRYLAPSATVQEPATAAQGTRRFGKIGR